MQILELSQTEIEGAIFRGAHDRELRCPLEAFSAEEILVLPRHPDWNTFDMEFREWMWDTIYAIIECPCDDP